MGPKKPDHIKMILSSPYPIFIEYKSAGMKASLATPFGACMSRLDAASRSCAWDVLRRVKCRLQEILQRNYVLLSRIGEPFPSFWIRLSTEHPGYISEGAGPIRFASTTSYFGLLLLFPRTGARIFVVRNGSHRPHVAVRYRHGTINRNVPSRLSTCIACAISI